MLQSRTFLFILAGVLHASYCLQRSDYIYDRETRMVTLTTNGTTYTCRAWAITDPVVDRNMEEVSGPCLYGEKSVDDPKCIRMDVFNILNHVMKDVQAEQGGPTSCDAPIPSVEETLDRIEKVYRSSSLDDNPATKEWAREALENVTRLRTECEANGTGSLDPELLKNAAELVLSGFLLGNKTLPLARSNVTEAQTVFVEAMKKEALLRADVLLFDRDDFHELRESLYVTEVLALEDSHQFELNTWEHVAKERTSFVNLVSSKKEMENEVTVAALAVGRAEMDMLSKMAKANEILATIDAIVREFAYTLKRACQTKYSFD